MAVYFDFAKNMFDLSVLADDKRGPLNSPVFPPVQAFLFINAVGIAHRFLGIAEKRERKAVLLDKLLMRGLIVQAHAQHHRSGLVNRRDRVPKIAGFARATRRVVLGIEI